MAKTALRITPRQAYPFFGYDCSALEAGEAISELLFPGAEGKTYLAGRTATRIASEMQYYPLVFGRAFLWAKEFLGWQNTEFSRDMYCLAILTILDVFRGVRKYLFLNESDIQAELGHLINCSGQLPSHYPQYLQEAAIAVGFKSIPVESIIRLSLKLPTVLVDLKEMSRQSEIDQRNQLLKKLSMMHITSLLLEGKRQLLVSEEFFSFLCSQPN